MQLGKLVASLLGFVFRYELALLGRPVVFAVLVIDLRTGIDPYLGSPQKQLHRLGEMV